MKRQSPPRRRPGYVVGAFVLAMAGTATAMAVTIPAHTGDGATAAAPAPAAAPAAGTATAMADMPGMGAPAASGSVKREAADDAPASSRPFPAALPPVGAGRVHRYAITLKDTVLQIAPGVRYRAWTFDGGAPGPVIHVRQGDLVKVTLRNGGAIPHSIDFHAARIAPNVAFRSVDPGKSISFSFRAGDAGVFMYHCGTPPVLAHIANGMYGAIVVDPVKPLPKVDRSYVLVSGEWYLAGEGTSQPASLDYEKARRMQPDWVTWNGRANQYKDHPLVADPGQRVRFYVVDAGPSLNTDFHVVGTVLDTVYPSGRASEALHDVQTWGVPAGGGAAFDVRIPAKGLYPVVSHSFASVDMGELAILKVGNVTGGMSH